MLLSDAQLRGKDHDTLRRFLRYRLGNYIVAIKDAAPNNHFYRGVKWQDRPTSVSQLSYPPETTVKTIGRANRIGQPMFYASCGAPPVFFELRSKQGDRIALSEWVITEPIWMHNLGYHADALRQLGAPHLAARMPLIDPIENETRSNAQLRRQLSLAFTEEVRPGAEYRYKKTIAINEVLFLPGGPLPLLPNGPTSQHVAGTVYPSKQMRGAADNVVLRPEFVDRHLALKSVRYVLVESADEENLSYSFLTLDFSQTFPNGTIAWLGIDTPEAQRRSHIALEGGAWIHRNGIGEVIDFH